MASVSIEDFKDYIEKHRITYSKTNPWTISRIGSGFNSGTLNITDKEFEDFMKMYASFITLILMKKIQMMILFLILQLDKVIRNLHRL